jgi:hypothetical protein
MTKRLTGVSLLLSGLILVACQAPKGEQGNSNTTTNSAATTAGKADPMVVEEVKEMLAKHDKALNDQNLDAVMATFSKDPKTVVLGTGQGAFLRRAELSAMHLAIELCGRVYLD